MRLAVLVVAGLGLAGCAGSPVGDAIAGPEKLAARDDATCQSYGATPGSNAYVQCRMITAQNRDENHRARLAAAQQSFAAASQAAQAPPQNCTIMRGAIATNVVCH